MKTNKIPKGFFTVSFIGLFAEVTLGKLLPDEFVTLVPILIIFWLWITFIFTETKK